MRMPMATAYLIIRWRISSECAAAASVMLCTSVSPDAASGLPGTGRTGSVFECHGCQITLPRLTSILSPSAEPPKRDARRALRSEAGKSSPQRGPSLPQNPGAPYV